MNNVFNNLEKYIDEKLWDGMEYIKTIDNIDLYKHSNTRKYINIDNNGNFYMYNKDGYKLISKEQALNNLLC